MTLMAPWPQSHPLQTQNTYPRSEKQLLQSPAPYFKDKSGLWAQSSHLCLLLCLFPENRNNCCCQRLKTSAGICCSVVARIPQPMIKQFPVQVFLPCFSHILQRRQDIPNSQGADYYPLRSLKSGSGKGTPITMVCLSRTCVLSFLLQRNFLML